MTESNAHYYAKECMKTWLERTWSYNTEHGYRNVLSHLSWENVTPGVYLEYPVLAKPLVDGRQDLMGLRCVWQAYPTTEEIERLSLKTIAVIDLVVCHKGVPKYGFEIVHRHPCSNEKRQFFRELRSEGYDFTVYEVSASWIMDQLHDRVPKILDMVKIN